MQKIDNVTELDPGTALQVAARKYEKELFDDAERYAHFALKHIWGEKKTDA